MKKLVMDVSTMEITSISMTNEEIEELNEMRESWKQKPDTPSQEERISMLEDTINYLLGL